ncbi:MAG: flippase-like domain-containing protein, partial [Planctomycetaceae bacterium]|nr:flippase-like domain-containing protein [Planctomycetaceae bacterium]
MDRSSPGKTPFYRAQWFWLTICTLSSVLFLWFAVAPLLKDPEAVPKIRSAFTQADYRTLPLFLLALFLFYWLKAWRWRLLLKPVGDYRPTTELFPPIMIGFAVNNVLPAHLGEFVRCFVFARQHKIAVTTSVSSVVLERVFDVIAILFYLGLGLLVVDIPDPTIATTAKLFALGATGCV